MALVAAAAVLAAVVGVSLAGDGGDEAAPRATTATTGTSAPAPTTTSRRATTSTTLPFETEVKLAAIALLEIRNDVFENPDVARVAEYIAPTCLCLERETAIIQGFVDHQVGWSVGLTAVEGIKLTAERPEDPELVVAGTQPSAELRTPAGVVLERVEGPVEVGYTMSLLRVDGSWRLNSLEPVDLDAESRRAVLEEGLP